MTRKVLRLNNSSSTQKKREPSAASLFGAGLPTHRPYRQPQQVMRDWAWRPTRCAHEWAE
jgi:hypothetical protein